jgi:hypothetical protein
MSGDAALSVLALALSAGALACGAGAVFARAVPAAAGFLASAAGLGATAVIVSGAEDAGLALMLVAAIWAPLLLLGVMVLSSRTMKATSGLRLLSGVAALAALGAPLAWSLTDLPPIPRAVQMEPNLAPWLTALVFAAVVLSVSSLGYGERGALSARPGVRTIPGAQATLGRSAQLVGAMLVFFTCLLLWTRAPGGVGFLAGLVLILAIVLHALVNGSSAVMALTPMPALRAVLTLGLLAAVAGGVLDHSALAGVVAEAGAFACSAAAGTMTIIVLFGRAPTLRGTDM